MAERKVIQRHCEKSYKDTVDSPELKSTKVNTSVVKESDVIVESLLRFSSWHKAKVSIALCLKYKRKFREKVMSKGKGVQCWITRTKVCQ